MHLLIDRERLCVLYKHSNLSALCNIAHIEVAHSPSIIAHYDDYSKSFADMGDWELRVLYEHLCGQKYQGYGRDHLERCIIALCHTIPESDINPHEAYIQASCIPDGDDRYYKYIRGSHFPSPQEELFAPASLKSLSGFIPNEPYSVGGEPKVDPSAAAEFLRIPRKPRSDGPSTPCESAPRVESNEPPKAGSKTGRVWEIADAVLAKYSAPYDWKKLRADIASACEAEGINSSTMSVQSSKWRKTKGI